jgi:RND family efflux transporter MFP subunit
VQYVATAAQKGTITSSISGSGNVIVDQSSNIDPTITGTVTNLAVNIGDKVKKGQLLFTIDNDQLGISVDQAQASVTSAQSSLDSAKSSKKSANASYVDTKKNKSSSYADVVSARDKLGTSDTAIESAQQNLDSSLANLSYQKQQAAKRQVTSPIDGTVNEVNIKNGDDLSKLSSGSSRTVPIIIGDLSTMKAQVQVNEVDIANVTIGQKAMMTFSGIDGLTVSGKVEKMDSIGTLSSGVVTYNVTIGFDTLDPRIKPEMSVSANIITDVKQDAITVPNSALKSQGNNTYVQVLNDGSTTPTQVTVQTGIANNTDTEITSGINAGDKVVTQTINSTSSTSSTSTTSSSRSSGSAIRLPGLSGGGGRGD